MYLYIFFEINIDESEKDLKMKYKNNLCISILYSTLHKLYAKYELTWQRIDQHFL